MPTRLVCPWDFPDKNAREDCHFLLQGVFPTQLSNLSLLHCRGILNHWTTWEAVNILRWPIKYSCSLQRKSMIYFYGSSTCYCSSESTTLTKFSWHKVFDVGVMLKLGIRNSEEISGMYTATSPLPTSHIFMSTLRNSIKPHISSKISVQVSFPLTVDFLGFFKLQSNFQIVCLLWEVKVMKRYKMKSRMIFPLQSNPWGASVNTHSLVCVLLNLSFIET